jgi:putative serine protease PepD
MGTAAGSRAGSASKLQTQYEQVVRHVLPSVVQISTSDSTGAGVVYDTKGDIVTNEHVIGTAKTVKVVDSVGNKTFTAKVVGEFAPDDLAVIRVESGAGDLKPAAFADSNNAQIGQIVLAMGNPLGLTDSVTQGIISATGRTVGSGDQGSGKALITAAIQTSAAINPGNSGGALVDLSGDVVGIPTLAATDPQLGGAAAGIGFAIPSSTARDIAQQLATAGKVTSSHRALLGVTRLATVTDVTGNPVGVLVAGVLAGGPADTAGVQQEDIITALNGAPMPSVEALQEAIAQHQPGDRVTLTVRRADGDHSITVTLGEQTG